MANNNVKRVLGVNNVDNEKGGTKRVIQVNSIDNTHGSVKRVYMVGGGGSAVINPLSVTPSTSAQTITASGGVDGYSPVNVSAVDSTIDANITAGNIKNGVSILGVEGTYTGSAPTGLYREFELNASGKLVSSTTASLMDFTNVKDIADYRMTYGYAGNTTITGTVNLYGLEQVSGQYACAYMFYQCNGITHADLSSLKTITGSNACNNMFSNCTNLTSVDISSLETINAVTGCNTMFGNYCGILSIDFCSLKTLMGYSVMGSMFANGHITRISFYALTPSSFGTQTNQFDNMLFNVTGCTVHFPMAIQSTIGSWASVTSGFGGTNTTVLFDIVTTLTGADSNSYTRKQKESTSTATAWTYNDTLYYTSGTTEPAVSDTIYSDAACTTAVTTISAIA